MVYIWRFWTKRRLFNVTYIVDNLFMKRPAKATSRNTEKFSEFLLKPHDFLKILHKIVENHTVITQKIWPQCTKDLAVVILDKTPPEQQQAKGRIFKI